ncbi:O-acetyl-ADP-ribose deacetylase [Klebsiella pneumoniae]|nr:O-acetyl-ADP-ribose deacetylase [Klebsiella pneumoniae]
MPTGGEMAVKPEVILGDITTLDVDVIVNAANPSLLGGGGVDGAIHRAAGPALLAACKQVLQQQGECPPGMRYYYCRQSAGQRGDPHRGPVWHGGDRMEAQTLADAYKNSLQLASANTIAPLRFPAISPACMAIRKRSGGDRRAHRHRVSHSL